MNKSLNIPNQTTHLLIFSNLLSTAVPFRASARVSRPEVRAERGGPSIGGPAPRRRHLACRLAGQLARVPRAGQRGPSRPQRRARRQELGIRYSPGGRDLFLGGECDDTFLALMVQLGWADDLARLDAELPAASQKRLRALLAAGVGDDDFTTV